MPEAVLGLGGNVGSRRALFACARDLLAAQPGLSLLALSPLYHTPPLGPPQPDYLNAALKLSWSGSARALLNVTQHVEQLLGRQRSVRWGPRTIDIDFLHWSGGDVDEPGLTIPHPSLCQRPFALVPLLAVAPELTPRFGAALGSQSLDFAPREAFEARVQRVGERMVSARSDDVLELLAALPSALAGFAPDVVGELGVLPFSLPFEAGPRAPALEALEGPLSELLTRVRAAFSAGFRVRSAAITEVGEGRLNGIFVGQHDPACAPLPSVRCTLELAADGATIWVART